MVKTLIVFARVPRLGEVKTRLAVKVGDKEALEVYNTLLNNAFELKKKFGKHAKVYWTEPWQKGVSLVQDGIDLGERMYNALLKELETADKVCLIGTDTPHLTDQIISNAFEALASNDVVFGPAKDGGYYLIAVKKPPPVEMMINKKWSHKHVLDEALEVCRKKNLKVHFTNTLLDIDTKDDLLEWGKTNE